MLSKEQKALEKKAERVALNPKRAVLTKSEQLDVFNRARLVLRLKAPSDLFDHESNEQLRKQQSHKIEDFSHLLHENLVTEFGTVLIAVYSCE